MTNKNQSNLVDLAIFALIGSIIFAEKMIY